MLGGLSGLAVMPVPTTQTGTHIFTEHQVISLLRLPLQYHRLSRLTNIISFVTVLEAAIPRSRCHQHWCLVKSLFLACRWPPSDVLMWPFLWAWSTPVSSYFTRAKPWWIRVPPLWPHVNLIASLRALSQNIVMLGVRTLTRILGEHNSVHKTKLFFWWVNNLP